MGSRKKSRITTTPTLDLQGERLVIGIREIYEEGTSSPHILPSSNGHATIEEDIAEPLHDLPLTEFVPFDEANKHITRSDHRCYGCDHDFGKQAIHGKWPGMDAVWETYSNNKASMNASQLYDLISVVQMEKIARPLIAEMYRREAEGGAPVTEEELASVQWHPEQIRAHITVHMVDPVFHLYDKMKTYAMMHASVKNNVYVKQFDGSVVPDSLKIQLMMKIDDHQLKLLHAMKQFK